MRGNRNALIVVALLLCCAAAPKKEKPKQNLSTDELAAVEANDREKDYYKIVNVPLPSTAIVEAGSFLALPDGRLAVGTRRGDVFLVRNAEADPPAAEFKLFAADMSEVLGLAWRDGTIYATQQGELTKLRDLDGDGKVDRYETVSAAWGFRGEHEYTFGSNFDRDGAIWTAHCLTGSYTSDHLFRGWVLRHFPDGRFEPMCSGLRSPGGIAFNSAGDAFCTENQGTWNGACGLKYLKPGGFMGHPASLKWYENAPKMGPRPEEPTGGDSGRVYLDAKRIPQLVPTAVIFPYKKMGQSASAVMLDESGGKFGPFGGQFFVADYTLSTVMRVYLEKVNGVYQGACFPFRQGFATGLIGGILTPRGKMLVGGSNRGWPSRGLMPAAMQRVDWTGKAPFEIREMRATPDGFELRFTAPVDTKSAADVESYTLETYTHYYHAGYGSPEIEQLDHTITSATPSEDRLSVRIVVDKLVQGHVHELHVAGVRDANGQPLLHEVAYYTLNEIPKAAEPVAPALFLVPMPKSIKTAVGVMKIGAANHVVYADESLAALAKVLSDEIFLTTGVRLAAVSGKGAAGDVVLQMDAGLKGESYTLQVKDAAMVKGGNYQSVAAGTATLLQGLKAENGVLTVPLLEIADEPAYPYRGALIDLGRKYHSPGGIEQVIELCRLYKIRYLHLHLTDDQLFMFPSTKFPQLGKGNWEFKRFEPASKPKISPYTLDELRGLERFAQERGVYLVPELDLPGHSGRLVGDAPEIFGIPGNGSTVNIASPKTLEAIQTLLNEVMDVFQSSPYVHLGADEVGLGGLDQTPDYKNAQAKFGIKSVHDLYCKFIVDVHAVVAKRGKKAIVWEEACNSGGAFPLPKDALVMVWSQGKNPNDIVRDGYSVINATWVPLYIVRDNKKSAEFLFDWSVPKFGREGSNEFTTLAETGRLMGAQLCSWENSESIEIQSMRDRLAVVAERGWNPQAGENFAAFKSRLAQTDALLEKIVHPIAIQVQGKFSGDENTFVEPLRLTLTPNRPGLTLKYTLDNSMPGEHWQTYSEPITLDKSVHLRAGLFDDHGAQQGYLVGNWFRSRIPAKANLATGKPVTVGPSPDRKDGWFAKIAVDGQMDDPGAHWASEGAAPQWLQVDLEKVCPIDTINLITYWDGGRYYQWTAEVSVDGKTWTKVLDFSENKTPATAKGYSGKFKKIDARYVRINMLKNSANPFVHIVELIVDESK